MFIESRGFSPGSPVSSLRKSWQGNLTSIIKKTMVKDVDINSINLPSTFNNVQLFFGSSESCFHGARSKFEFTEMWLEFELFKLVSDPSQLNVPWLFTYDWLTYVKWMEKSIGSWCRIDLSFEHNGNRQGFSGRLSFPIGLVFQSDHM